MPIITLTSDFGYKDPSVASLKAKIYAELNTVTLVDISHAIQPFDIAEGAFVLKNAYPHFPKGSIHLIAVDELIHPNKKPIVALIDDHYFISSDNGILSLIHSDIRPTSIVEIIFPKVDFNADFPSRDIFAPVACHLARGGNLNLIGQKINTLKELYSLRPVIKDEQTIIGNVIYIDNYGNSITNITQKVFQKIGNKRSFTIQHLGRQFDTIYQNYHEIVRDFDNEALDTGKPMALFGSSGFLEIAVYKGNPQNQGGANTLLGLKKGTEIRVNFH